MLIQVEMSAGVSPPDSPFFFTLLTFMVPVAGLLLDLNQWAFFIRIAPRILGDLSRTLISLLEYSRIDDGGGDTILDGMIG